jgi:hypothetical protein
MKRRLLGKAGRAGHLQGYPAASAFAIVDFRQQQGVYCLYDDNFKMVYVGQAGANDGNRLFDRLKQHKIDATCRPAPTPSHRVEPIGLAIDLNGNRPMIARFPEPSLSAAKLAERAESVTTSQSRKVCTGAPSNAPWRELTGPRRSSKRISLSSSAGC